MNIVFLFADRNITTLPGGCFIPVCSAAIPAGSKNAENATEFIKTMLQDKDTQETKMEQGFSVIIDNHLPFYKKVEKDIVGKPSEFDWDSLISGFPGPTITEAVLKEKLYQQAELLYQNNITVDEAVENVVKNTRLYFEERN